MLGLLRAGDEKFYAALLTCAGGREIKSGRRSFLHSTETIQGSAHTRGFLEVRWCYLI